LLANLVEILSTRKVSSGASGTVSTEASTNPSANDPVASEVYGQFGMVSRPSKGTHGFRVSIGGLSIIIAAVRHDVDPPDNPGEVKHYSTDENGVVKSLHVLTSDGKHVFNGGGDNAVAHADLQTDLDSLASDINTELGKIATAITNLGGAYVHTPVSVDISAAKVGEIELP